MHGCSEAWPETKVRVPCCAQAVTMVSGLLFDRKSLLFIQCGLVIKDFEKLAWTLKKILQ
jgi:hypothetical protein